MKALIITNLTKKIRPGHFSMIEPLQKLGLEVSWAANFSQYGGNIVDAPIKLHHIDFYRNPFNPKNLVAYKQLSKLLREEKFDLIHCNNPIGGLLGRICGSKARVKKIIYTVHGFHFYKGASLINITLFKWAEMWLARHTDAIITINIEDYESAQKFNLRNNGKVYYVPGVGVDTTSIKNTNGKRNELLNEINVKDDAILLISVGELNTNKNNSVIIEALRKLNNSCIHYLLCGVGDKECELKNKVKEYGLEKNVHFLGYRNDIPQLLKSSDVYLLPSYREGLSRSLMEAMGAGLPCIVSEIRGNVDLIQEGVDGFLRAPNDSEGFAEAINILASDKELREKMKISNLETIKKFDVENVKKEMKKIYEEELI